MVSYYQVLGVSENASQDTIKQAYRDRMKAHHSDLHGQADDPIVRLIAEAYSVLSNRAGREQYNRRLHQDENSRALVFKPRQPPTVTSPSHTQTRTPQSGSRLSQTQTRS